MSFQQQSNALAGKMLILVVDDDPVQQQATSRQLLELGLRAELVSDGAQALRWLENARADLIFLDCQMPVLDGYALAREIHRREVNPPVLVALTGLNTSANRLKCRAAGMDDFLAKPIECAALRLCLERWLGSFEPSPPLDEEFRSQLIPIFLQDAPRRLQSMRRALESNDAPALELAAHTLKSSSALLGATRLSQGCQILETIGESGTFEGVVDALEKVEAEFDLVCRELQSSGLEPQTPQGR